jgi:hypothetical protein
MKDYVSSHRPSAFALVASMSVAYVLIVPYGFPWASAWAIAAMSLFTLFAMRTIGPRSPVTHTVRVEPTVSVVAPERVAMCLGAAPLRFNGERTL